MKALAFSILCFASALLADDFKTIHGKEYNNATVIRVEADGIVLKTKFGISKVYFAELPEEVRAQFHYHPSQAERERAAETEERPKKERSAAAALASLEEDFQAAEFRAAHFYKTSEKGTLSGQVFVATKGGENVKLGAVQVSLFASDAIDVLMAGLHSFAAARLEQLRLDIAAATAAERQAEAAQEQAEATQKGIENGISFADGGRALDVARESARAARDAAEATRQQIPPLLAEQTYYVSNHFYFSHLQSPIQATETDGEGRFAIQVPRTGEFVIAAHAERIVGGKTETYYWLRPVSLDGEQQHVQNLSNSNVTSATELR